MPLPSAASVVSSGLGAYPTVYYDRVAVETLRSNLFLYNACELKTMPDKSGVSMQIFDYSAMAANVTPATEGTPGAGQTLTQNKRSIDLAQFVDYVSFSDKVVLTGISDTVAEGAAELAFRGALSVDTVISTAVDTAAGLDATACIDIAHGKYFDAATSRKAAMKLRAKNIKPKSNGLFFGILPSLMAYDLVNDATAGGFIDIQKHVDSGVAALQNGIPATARVGVIGGVEWFESNSLPVTEDYDADSGSTAYHGYVFGQNAIFASSLGKTKLGQKNFTVKVSKFEQPIAVDPANQIAAAASYNFFFGVAKRPGTVNGFMRVRSESSIA